MKAKGITLLLGLAVVALGVVAFLQRQTIRDLRAQVETHRAAAALAAAEPRTAPAAGVATADAGAPAVARMAPDPAPAQEAAPAAATDRREPNATQRVMRDFARMLENPQMNEVMQASQRATLEVLYKDLLDAYQLSPDERKHLMDLLMSRQMFRVETSMKMMGGNNSAEEMHALGEEMKEYDKAVKAEIETFLNDPKDTAAFDYYEKTMQERMMLSGVKAEFAKAQTPLAEGIDRQLVDIMARQKAAHTFRSDLADENNYSLDATRFSQANISAFEQDLTELHGSIVGEARSILTADQLALFTRTLQQAREMQLSQIRMAAAMFGGPSKPE